jgi:hypothetical protein
VNFRLTIYSQSEAYFDWQIGDTDENLAYYNISGIPVIAIGYNNHFDAAYYDFDGKHSIRTGGFLTPFMNYTTDGVIGGNDRFISKLESIRLHILGR